MSNKKFSEKKILKFKISQKKIPPPPQKKSEIGSKSYKKE